jgi:hypothetical protein
VTRSGTYPASPKHSAEATTPANCAAQPSNILCLCHACHSWCHAHPRYAERGGWFVRSAVDVDLTTERVWLQGRSLYLTGWCTLTLDGRWTWLGSDDPAPEMPASARAVAVVR